MVAITALGWGLLFTCIVIALAGLHVTALYRQYRVLKLSSPPELKDWISPKEYDQRRAYARAVLRFQFLEMLVQALLSLAAFHGMLSLMWNFSERIAINAFADMNEHSTAPIWLGLVAVLYGGTRRALDIGRMLYMHEKHSPSIALKRIAISISCTLVYAMMIRWEILGRSFALDKATNPQTWLSWYPNVAFLFFFLDLLLFPAQVPGKSSGLTACQDALDPSERYIWKTVYAHNLRDWRRILGSIQILLLRCVVAPALCVPFFLTTCRNPALFAAARFQLDEPVTVVGCVLFLQFMTPVAIFVRMVCFGCRKRQLFRADAFAKSFLDSYDFQTQYSCVQGEMLASGEKTGIADPGADAIFPLFAYIRACKAMECANAVAFVGDPLYCALYPGLPSFHTRLLALALAPQEPAALQDDETGTVIEIFNHDHDLCIPTIMINP